MAMAMPLPCWPAAETAGYRFNPHYTKKRRAPQDQDGGIEGFSRPYIKRHKDEVYQRLAEALRRQAELSRKVEHQTSDVKMKEEQITSLIRQMGEMSGRIREGEHRRQELLFQGSQMIISQSKEIQQKKDEALELRKCLDQEAKSNRRRQELISQKDNEIRAECERREKAENQLANERLSHAQVIEKLKKELDSYRTAVSTPPAQQFHPPPATPEADSEADDEGYGSTARPTKTKAKSNNRMNTKSQKTDTTQQPKTASGGIHKPKKASEAESKSQSLENMVEVFISSSTNTEQATGKELAKKKALEEVVEWKPLPNRPNLDPWLDQKGLADLEGPARDESRIVQLKLKDALIDFFAKRWDRLPTHETVWNYKRTRMVYFTLNHEQKVVMIELSSSQLVLYRPDANILPHNAEVMNDPAKRKEYELKCALAQMPALQAEAAGAFLTRNELQAFEQRAFDGIKPPTCYEKKEYPVL